MPITTGYQTLLENAMREVRTYSVQEALVRIPDGKVKLVDIRDVRELELKGGIPKSIHAPRGMLEFWVDPASPYFKPVFGDESAEYILFCAAGWRSALAAKTLQDMGMRNVAHIEGGFSAWCKASAPIESKPAPGSLAGMLQTMQNWLRKLKRSLFASLALAFVPLLPR